jgi:hypothetical protein
MSQTLGLFLFTLLYYELNSLLKPCIYNKFDVFNEEPIVFNPIMQKINLFILYLFVILNANLLIFSKIKKPALYTLSLIYFKYVLDNIIEHNTIGLYQYELRRTIMWLFKTPIILQLYCDMNNLNLITVKAQYHVISNFIYILFFPFRKTYYNTYIVLSLSLFEGCFIYKLLDFKQQRYTTFIIFIWSLFTFINVMELTQFLNIYDIQLCYLVSDMIAKLTTILIVHDYEEQTYHIKTNVDLQSINLITAMKKTILQQNVKCL